MFPGKGETYTYLNSEEIRNYSDICVHMPSLIYKESSPFSMVLAHNKLIKGKCSSPFLISAQPSLGKRHLPKQKINVRRLVEFPLKTLL